MKRLISKVKQVLFGAVVRTRARTVGKGLKVNRYSWVSKSVVLGDNVNFNGMRIVGEGEIRIGSNFHSGRGCSIIGSFHDFDYGDAVPYGMAKIDKDVVIEDNVWLGGSSHRSWRGSYRRGRCYTGWECRRRSCSKGCCCRRSSCQNVQDARYGSLRSSESTRSVLLIFRQRAGKKGWIASDNEVNSWRYHAGVMLR